MFFHQRFIPGLAIASYMVGDEKARECAVIDPTRSEVIDRDRGLFTRVGDLFSDDTNNERDLYLRAGKKLDAAAKESELRDRAERNTRLMLEGLLGRLGYSDVRVTFEKPAPPTTSERAPAQDSATK